MHPDANAAAGPRSECVRFAVNTTITNATAIATAPLTLDAMRIVPISRQ
jgi:hypothetical protein